MNINWKQRYTDAHREHFAREYPAAFRDGFYTPPVLPKVTTSNGLTKFCINFLTWSGQYGNRINTMGRLVDGMEKQPSGTVLQIKKWIPSTTKRGTADISGILNGRHVSVEVKIGRDALRPDQIKERQRVERAGGIYIVVKTPEDFLYHYDRLTILPS